MAALPVSVVVASHGRADVLPLCLTGLGQLQYHPFEIVVVADAQGCAAARAHALGPSLKIVACDEANISHARNLGIGQAAGEIVAFIDDDAVPEPGWLAHLATAFARDDVVAAGGFVIGRNGFSLQWGARSVDREGWHHDIVLEGVGPTCPAPPPGGAVRTEGTNMAVRRTVLAKLGGFDTVFRYYFDDTDLNMRIAQAGGAVAIVPRARVWHHQAVSARRDANRTPRTLYEIGASTAAFLVRHAGPERFAPALAMHRAAERRRLLRHMVAGRLVPGDVARLLATFDAGAAEGEGRQGAPVALSEVGAFRPLHKAPQPPAIQHVTAGWAWHRRKLRAEADRHAGDGALVHVQCLMPTALFHRRRYELPGVWVQTGGLFGRSFRDDPLVSWNRLDNRVRREAAEGPLASIVPIDAWN